MRFNCAHCGIAADRPSGHVNRSRAKGDNLYCGRVCSGLGRRASPKTPQQRKAEKRAYDIAYRNKNRAALRAKKAVYFQQTYDPAKAAVERKKRSASHSEYCRRPEYKMWKREYDRKYRAQEYGAFAEAFLVLQDLDRELDARADWYERASMKGTINKTLRRKRDYEQSVSRQP